MTPGETRLHLLVYTVVVEILERERKPRLHISHLLILMEVLTYFIDHLSSSVLIHLPVKSQPRSSSYFELAAWLVAACPLWLVIVITGLSTALSP